MRDNAGDNKSLEIIDFFESKGIKNYFSTAHERGQNGLGLRQSAINSIMMVSRTIMVESGLGGRFWFQYAVAGGDARNATYKHCNGEREAERISTTPWRVMHGKKKGHFPISCIRMQGWFISIQKGERKANIRSKLLR
jgi:hypothetical protein